MALTMERLRLSLAQSPHLTNWKTRVSTAQCFGSAAWKPTHRTVIYAPLQQHSCATRKNINFRETAPKFPNLIHFRRVQVNALLSSTTDAIHMFNLYNNSWLPWTTKERKQKPSLADYDTIWRCYMLEWYIQSHECVRVVRWLFRNPIYIYIYKYYPVYFSENVYDS